MIVRRRMQFNNLFETTYGIVLGDHEDHYDVMFHRDMTTFRGRWPKDGFTVVVPLYADSDKPNPDSIGRVLLGNGKELLVRQTPVGIEFALVDSPVPPATVKWPENVAVQLYVRKNLHQTLFEVASSFGFVSEYAGELLDQAADDISQHPANQGGEDVKPS